MKDMMIKLNNYKRELVSISKELQSLPEGRLSKKGSYYHHVINEKKTGVTKNEKVLRQLCRKKYLQARQKLLTHNASAISVSLSKLKNTTNEEIIDSFASTYKQLPSDYFYHPSMKDWLDKPYKKNSYPTGNENYFSKIGTAVRSKSEVLIANLLEDYHIPYHYDVALVIGNKTRYPDFIIKNPFDGRLIIWEHFGALNQEGYAEKMNSKMTLYMIHGFKPFENLICTFEFDMKNDSRLKDLIEQIIL